MVFSMYGIIFLNLQSVLVISEIKANIKTLYRKTSAKTCKILKERNRSFNGENRLMMKENELKTYPQLTK